MSTHSHASSSSLLLLRHRPRLIRPFLPLRPRLPYQVPPAQRLRLPASFCFTLFGAHVAPASHFPLFFFVPSSAARSVARSPFPGDSRLWLCVMSCTDDPFELYFALFGALWLLFRLFPLFFSILLYAPLCSFARPRGFTIVGMRNELYG